VVRAASDCSRGCRSTGKDVSHQSKTCVIGQCGREGQPVVNRLDTEYHWVGGSVDVLEGQWKCWQGGTGAGPTQSQSQDDFAANESEPGPNCVLLALTITTCSGILAESSSVDSRAGHLEFNSAMVNFD